MAVLFDVAQSSNEFTGENTLLFPWRPQQEGCCHSRRQGSWHGRWHSGNSTADPGSTSQASAPPFQECFIKAAFVLHLLSILQWNECLHSPRQSLASGDKTQIKQSEDGCLGENRNMLHHMKQHGKLQEYLHLPRV